MGFLDLVVGLLGEAIGVQQKKIDKIEEEKARLSEKSPEQLVQIVKSQQSSSRGMAAMQLLKEMGFSRSDIEEFIEY
ncbi:hypothetical protein ACYULU_06500 [Breznakiellaceae bacterium SP9]